MIFCHKWLNAAIPIESNLYEEKLASASDTIRVWLTESRFEEDKTGLYLATTNAGVFESISFWKNALINSPGFANPANFNWTLSNGPASFLTRELKIKGPCYTLIGNVDAVEGCLYHAMEDLNSKIVTTAIVCGLDIFDEELHFCTCLLSHLKGEKTADSDSIRYFGKNEKYASSLLLKFLRENES